MGAEEGVQRTPQAEGNTRGEQCLTRPTFVLQGALLGPQKALAPL